MDNIKIISNRLILRTLQFHENLDSYLSWMQDIQNNKYILSVRSDYSRKELSSFIDRNNRSSDQILLGIFTKNLKHIGNVRYSNIDLNEKTAEVGFLIGDLNFRGLGVTQEAFLSSVKWINSKMQIVTVYLGVDVENKPAIKLYNKLGFLPLSSPSPKSKSMRMKFEFLP